MRRYEDLTRIHENTLPPRAHYIPYDTLEKALKGDKAASAYYKLLNGDGISGILQGILTVRKRLQSGTRFRCLPAGR